MYSKLWGVGDNAKVEFHEFVYCILFFDKIKMYKFETTSF